MCLNFFCGYSNIRTYHYLWYYHRNECENQSDSIEFAVVWLNEDIAKNGHKNWLRIHYMYICDFRDNFIFYSM